MLVLDETKQKMFNIQFFFLSKCSFEGVMMEMVIRILSKGLEEE